MVHLVRRFADDVVHGALVSGSDRAFDRWRDLFFAAEQQRDAARRTMDDYCATRERAPRSARLARPGDRPAQPASTRHRAQSSSDFYTYRYLATEGFLPGLQLPASAADGVRAGDERRRGRQTYLQRPRFLALVGVRSAQPRLPRGTRLSGRPRDAFARPSDGRDRRDARCRQDVVRSAAAAAPVTSGRPTPRCVHCRAAARRSATPEIVNPVPHRERLTQPAERITANDEERQRQGFELQTTFEWAVRDQVLDVRERWSRDEGEIVRARYGPGATITRLNKGLRRRAIPHAVRLQDRSCVRLLGQERGRGRQRRQADPTSPTRQWIVPSVQDRKNALLLQPWTRICSRRPTLATVQHALLRGIESVFQLEEGEILAEPMPTAKRERASCSTKRPRAVRACSRGSWHEPDTCRGRARGARSMHFDVARVESRLPEAGRTSPIARTPCVAACYRCLMSYFNQPDHELIDRRDERRARSCCASRVAGRRLCACECDCASARHWAEDGASLIARPHLARC